MFDVLQQMEFIQKQRNVHKYTSSVIANKYILGPVIGKGSFGEVYLATVEGQQTLYAVKKEDQYIKHPQLINESKILKLLDKFTGFPKLYYFGQENRANYIVTDLLGASLEDMFQMCQRQFSLKTVLMIAEQMIARIEQFHGQNYIHRDLKPQNFLTGLEDNSHLVYLIDFGLSKRYRDPKTHQHIPYKENRPLTGTIRYSSINSHFAFQQSRRDDLESIGLILVYFLQGGLPWQGVKGNNKAQRYQKILQKKQSVPIQLICKGLPIQFSTFINYCHTLKFEEKPDYKYLKKLFRDLFSRVGYVWDYEYDWCSFKNRREVSSFHNIIRIEKKGDEIQDLYEQNKNPHQINQQDIKLTVETNKHDPWLVAENQSQNMCADSIEISDLSILGKSGGILLTGKKMQFKTIEEW